MNESQYQLEALLAARLAEVRARIAAAERTYGRPAGAVTLLAVSKTQPVEAVAAAFKAGQREFGESYLQEAQPKLKTLGTEDVTWHFTGALQSNKSAWIAQHFAWVHSVDRLKIAERLSAQRPPHLPALNVCIQVNVGDEPQKAGIDPGHLPVLAHAIAALPHLRLRGLMTLPRSPMISPLSGGTSARCARHGRPCANKVCRWTPFRWACRKTWKRPSPKAPLW